MILGFLGAEGAEFGCLFLLVGGDECEAFDFPVGPRAVRFDEALLRADLRDGVLERDRFPVDLTKSTMAINSQPWQRRRIH